MSILDGLLQGFAVALTVHNVAWCFVGVFLGTIIGILPGLGPAATIALLLPLTYDMEPTGGIIMLAGIYYGAKYGGSTTSILLNMPGEASSVATCIDGYQMAKAGRAGPALGIAAIASFIAGTIGVLALTLIAPPIAAFALSFSSPEYFALMCLGLSLVVLLGGDSMVKGLLSLFVGLWLAGIGTDIFTAQSRFTFGTPALLDGLDFMVIAIGVFAISEVLATAEERGQARAIPVPRGIRNLLPSLAELKACRFAFLNGSVVGFIVGVLPGAGSSIASFIAYGIEKAVSRHPERFGNGAPEGVAAPEGANNADSGGALVPLLTLGIPGGGTTAILLSALIVWGIRPGPLMITESPDVFWGLVASMYIGNVILLILNLPLVPLFAQLLRVPVWLLLPIVLGISLVGAYAVSGSLLDVWLLAGFGLLGYLMNRLGFPAAPLILGFVLGDGMERAIRQSLMMSQGDLSILVSRPISATMLGLSLLILALPLLRWRRTRQATALGE
ncbi:tripartite tricarboxylate transporter permease [Mongoliimonas terrestris]|uniref:tripartite tricarboxylate transporter permease n=1 Tax=Mongoliimonas terrestris TaxID=1709001 RepID=UPI0009499AF4|nr:tripartite tricarboxylate transporter permease [Mongoliimonas terrestris]